MRKVVIAGVAAAAALAWAPGARADDASKQKSQGAEQQHGSQSAATPPGRETAAGGQDRTSREMRSDARADQDAPSRAGEKREPFHGQKNFDVDGRVSHASSGEVTIERKDMPPATLKVAPGTKVEVDGKAASAGQLRAGQEVRASFNLRGGTAEAVEVKAKKPSQDDTQKLREERRETQKEMSEKQKQR